MFNSLKMNMRKNKINKMFGILLLIVVSITASCYSIRSTLGYTENASWLIFGAAVATVILAILVDEKIG